VYFEGLSGSTGSRLPEARELDDSKHTILGSQAGFKPPSLSLRRLTSSWQSTMSGKPVVLLGDMEEGEDEDKPPEQPIVERDPTGRWSRVRICTNSFKFNFTSSQCTVE